MSIAYQAHAREIVEQVRDWPVEARQELVQSIISTLPQTTNGRRGKSLKNLLGLLKTGDRVPDDAECRAMLEEELIRKHVR